VGQIPRGCNNSQVYIALCVVVVWCDIKKAHTKPLRHKAKNAWARAVADVKHIITLCVVVAWCEMKKSRINRVRPNAQTKHPC